MTIAGERPTPAELADIAGSFAVGGEVLEIVPYGTGHINDTYASRVLTLGGTIRFIHQRINHAVFKDPEKVTANIDRVTAHLRRKVEAAGGDPGRECLEPVPVRDGDTLLRRDDGTFWRTYRFIEGARTYDRVTDAATARRAAGAFGRFLSRLADLPGAPLHETIPHFHDTPWRFERFRETLAADALGRAAGARPEIDFAEARAGDASRFVDLHRDGRLPLRTTHNDTKINNVMIDEASGLALCVIDLDTVMPGFLGFDFGECVRTAAATAAEDETDLARIGIDLDMFEVLAAGFIEAAGATMSPAEIETLPAACRMMAFENGLRFLTDHQSGDVYFKIHRPGHNLDRCRAQFRLAEAMERAMPEMERIVGRYA